MVSSALRAEAVWRELRQAVEREGAGSGGNGGLRLLLTFKEGTVGHPAPASAPAERGA